MRVEKVMSLYISFNLYVTIEFIDWTDKHPHGRLNNVIGPVNILDNYYEYQLYCKSLNASIQKFQKDTSKALEKYTQNDKNSHEDFIKSINISINTFFIFTLFLL